MEVGACTSAGGCDPRGRNTRALGIGSSQFCRLRVGEWLSRDKSEVGNGSHSKCFRFEI